MGAARIFRLATPFTEDEVEDLGYEQSADVMVLTHLNHPIQELRRYSHNRWLLSAAAFGSDVIVPTSPNAVATSPEMGTGWTPTDQVYVVTGVKADTFQESVASVTATCNNDLDLDGNYNTITWTGDASNDRYNVYKGKNGIYGFIGTSAGLTFTDDNILPDLSDTPPVNTEPFNAAGDYPARVTFHEQRAVYARTLNKPNAMFASQSADFFNMNVSRPAKASDAITVGLVARQVNAIQHVVSLREMLAFTMDAVFSIRSEGGFLAPSDFVIRPQSYRGSSKVRPEIIDDVVFFNTAKGNSLRTIGYQFSVDGYKGNDLTVFAPHFFATYTTKCMAWTESPMAALWLVRSDGKLCVLTWQAEQEVWGWTLCETTGTVEWCSAITENGEDVLYVIVARTINGVARRYVERMATSLWTDVADSVYCDASRSYVGDPEAPVTVLHGLLHLAGEPVAILANGAVVKDIVVAADGGITLPWAAWKVTAGLAYEAWAQTLPQPQPVQGRGSTAGNPTMVAKAELMVLNTRGIEVAPGKPLKAIDADTSDNCAAGTFYEAKTRAYEDYDSPPDLISGPMIAEVANGDWQEATLVIRSAYPLPFTITMVGLIFDLGGQP